MGRSRDARRPGHNSIPLPALEPVPKSRLKPSLYFDSVYDAWTASRAIPGVEGARLLPGSQRPFNLVNALSAYTILKTSAPDLIRILWNLHPARTTLMIFLNLLRSLFPVFKGYSQALVIDEV